MTAVPKIGLEQLQKLLLRQLVYVELVAGPIIAAGRRYDQHTARTQHPTDLAQKLPLQPRIDVFDRLERKHHIERGVLRGDLFHTALNETEPPAPVSLAAFADGLAVDIDSQNGLGAPGYYVRSVTGSAGDVEHPFADTITLGEKVAVKMVQRHGVNERRLEAFVYPGSDFFLIRGYCRNHRPLPGRSDRDRSFAAFAHIMTLLDTCSISVHLPSRRYSSIFFIGNPASPTAMEFAWDSKNMASCIQ